MKSASCHCGAICIEFDEYPESLTECNCSICHRLGVLWAYYTQQQVRVICSPGSISTYVWGDKCIEFCHCKTCGCVTHYTSVEKNDDSRIAINARIMRLEEVSSISIRKFDGASMPVHGNT